MATTGRYGKQYYYHGPLPYSSTAWRCLRIELGYKEFSGFQLKIIQEVVTLLVFIGFAVMFLKEKLAWNYLVAFSLLGVAVFFAFAFKVR